ncbi:hypothetical protein OUZ56_008747 [Daphnia magna]|uniref:Uncharacterized protein n=1 Tax=Daphnia magna TaxID=35525 RepID=A0ABR0ADW9_9CRUS|nr:hypothetical protein OUZ56_008747 [Daphnia magna]
MRCPIWCDEGGVQLPPGAAPLPNSQRCQCSIFVKLYMYRQQRQSIVPVRLGKKGSKYIAFAAASGVQPGYQVSIACKTIIKQNYNYKHKDKLIFIVEHISPGRMSS